MGPVSRLMLPPTRASAITAITGKATAVTINPRAAGHRCSPDCSPTSGENDVAGADKQGEGHKAQGDNVFRG